MTEPLRAPSLDIAPVRGLLDEPLTVTLVGFPPGASIELTSSVTVPSGDRWSATSTYRARADGRVDLARDTPVAGEVDIADPSSPIWALRPESADVNPRAFGERLEPYSLEVRARSGDHEVATSVERIAIADDVAHREVREQGLSIDLFLPPGEGPFPTVLVVGGSGGGFPNGQAALFASRGIAAVSLAYFKVPGLPDELLQIPLEYFEAALEWIAAQPELDARQLAISGTSRGGELALLLASRYPAIRSVVAWVPSGYLWGAVSARTDGDERDRDAFASWTVGGKALPYAGRVRNDDVEPDTGNTLRLTPAFHRYVESPDLPEGSVIPVEQIAGPVLLISGEDDALWPSAFFGRQIEERLRARGFDFAVEHVAYDGAGHGIGAGIAPTTTTRGFHPVRKQYIEFGGSPAAQARARADAWQRALTFVRTHTAVPASSARP